MVSGISGKVALVTGGATGIGRATAIALAECGAKVAVATGRNRQGAEDTVRKIEKLGTEGVFVQCDVTDEAQVKNMVKTTVDRFGRLDFAFNNAGVGPDGVRIPYGPLTELTLENFDKVVNTNFKGVFLCLKHELRQMMLQKSGSIVNNASLGGLKMVPGFGAYGPSKAAVVAITRTAALEHAAGWIRVNVVCPGPTLGTDLMKNTLSVKPEEEENLTSHLIPMARLGSTNDVAKAVLWLFSDDASYITGQAFSVDGGMSAM